MLRLTYPYSENSRKPSVSMNTKTEVLFPRGCLKRKRTRSLNNDMSRLSVILLRFPSTKKEIMNISPNALPDGKSEFKGNQDDNNPFEEV
jgi:hypothetical protein